MTYNSARFCRYRLLILGRCKGRLVRLPTASQRCQLRGQAWLNLQLSRQFSQPNRPLTLLAATVNPVASTEDVRAEFCEAVIPDDVITKVLRQYPTYLRWPIDSKLRPALQLWLTHLWRPAAVSTT